MSQRTLPAVRSRSALSIAMRATVPNSFFLNVGSRAPMSSLWVLRFELRVGNLILAAVCLLAPLVVARRTWCAR